MWIGMHVDECAVSMHCNRYVAAVLGEIAAAKGPDAGSAVAGESDDEFARESFMFADALRIPKEVLTAELDLDAAC